MVPDESFINGLHEYKYCVAKPGTQTVTWYARQDSWLADTFCSDNLQSIIEPCILAQGLKLISNSTSHKEAVLWLEILFFSSALYSLD